MADTTTTSGKVKLSSKALSLDEAALALLRAVGRGVRLHAGRRHPEGARRFPRGRQAAQDDGVPPLLRGNLRPQCGAGLRPATCRSEAAGAWLTRRRRGRAPCAAF